MLSGDDYIEAMNVSAADRECRRAFQNLATSLVPPGSAVFDFGCGPGVDAKLYTNRGLRVGAYDIDARMCESFAVNCAAELARGAVHLETGDYQGFLQRRTSSDGSKYRLITANFAPVNLVPNVHELFVKFSTMLTPGGQVLASILNPMFAGDMRYAWWWRNGVRLCVHGSYSVPGGQAPIRRWLPKKLAEQAAPAFGLAAVYRGLPMDETEGSLPRRLRPAVLRDWPSLASCRFLFILFRHTANHK